MSRIAHEFVAPVMVRVTEACHGMWWWRVSDGAASCQGASHGREEAWVCALSAMRGALALRRLRRALKASP